MCRLAFFLGDSKKDLPRITHTSEARVCVSLFYVIDTGSTGSWARHRVTDWGVPIYAPRFKLRR